MPDEYGVSIFNDDDDPDDGSGPRVGLTGILLLVTAASDQACADAIAELMPEIEEVVASHDAIEILGHDHPLAPQAAADLAVMVNHTRRDEARRQARDN